MKKNNEEKIDNALKVEKEVQGILDKIETMDHSLEGTNEISNGLLGSLLDYYYLNYFNGSTLLEDHGIIGFVGIEKMKNAYRVARLLTEYNGINEDNQYKINIMLRVLNKLDKDYQAKNEEIYENTHRPTSTFAFHTR